MRETRRNVLKTGGSALAGLSAVSGCLGLGGEPATDQPAESENDGNSGGDGGDGDESTPTGTPTLTPAGSRPETPTGDITKWMPEPGAIDQRGYAFLGMAPQAMTEFEDSLGEGALGQFDERYPISGVGSFREQRALYRFARNASVIVGEFDRTDVEDGLRTLGFEAGEARHGFRILESNDPRAAAVRDGMLVTVGPFGSGDETDKRSVVEAIVDARTGNGPRYVDEVADCAALVDAIGSAHVLQGRTHETGETFENGVGEGMGYHVGSEETQVRAAAVFTDGNADQAATADGDAGRSAMADWAADSDAFLGGEPTVRTDGRVVGATAFVPTGDVTEFPGDYPGPAIESESPGPPTVSFAFDYESTGDGVGRLTITHEAGDTVASDALFVRGNGFATVDAADQTGPGPWQGSASGDGTTVVAGDSVTVGVTSDYEIEVVWKSSDGDSPATLAVDDGPDA
jgi:hypothetical protein